MSQSHRDGRIHVIELLEATGSGTRKHLHNIMTTLPAEEFNVLALCAVRRDPAFHEDIAQFRALGHEFRELDMVRSISPWRDWRAGRAIRQLLESRPCDVLHVHSSKAGWLGRWAARSTNCRVIYTPHAFPFLQRISKPWLLTYRLLERWAVRHTDLLLAVEQEEARLAVDVVGYPPNRVRVLANAIDVDAIDAKVAAVRPQLSPKTTTTFGLLGESRPQKDPLTFVRAAAVVHRLDPTTRFVLPERGPLIDEVRRFIDAQGLSTAFEFLHCTKSLDALLARTDVAVLASLWEGLSYALLEAFAIGLPTIATNIPSMRNELGQCTFSLFEPGDADALAKRMLQILQLTRSERRCIGARGRRHVLEHHRFDRWQGDLRSIYRDQRESTRLVH